MTPAIQAFDAIIRADLAIRADLLAMGREAALWAQWRHSYQYGERRSHDGEATVEGHAGLGRWMRSGRMHPDEAALRRAMDSEAARLRRIYGWLPFVDLDESALQADTDALLTWAARCSDSFGRSFVAMRQAQLRGDMAAAEREAQHGLLQVLREALRGTGQTRSEWYAEACRLADEAGASGAPGCLS